jgi:Zyg-11 protein homolog
MMGLLGNVAEVKHLRHRLMTLAHIASDGAEAWTILAPSRELVLDRLMQAVDRWDLNAERNINYRSFEPILGLVKCYDTPACQIWAVWALANLTKVIFHEMFSISEMTSLFPSRFILTNTANSWKWKME